MAGVDDRAGAVVGGVFPILMTAAKDSCGLSVASYRMPLECHAAIPTPPPAMGFNFRQCRVRRRADAEPVTRVSRAIAAARKRATPRVPTGRARRAEKRALDAAHLELLKAAMSCSGTGSSRMSERSARSNSFCRCSAWTCAAKRGSSRRAVSNAATWHGASSPMRYCRMRSCVLCPKHGVCPRFRGELSMPAPHRAHPP
jgi:hypothetical protein